MTTPNRSLMLAVTPYAVLTLLAWGLMYAQFLQGVNLAALSTGEYWYVVASFWLHFAALALLAGLTAGAIGALLRRHPALAAVAVGVLGATATVWLFVDSRLYSVTGLHANRFVLEALLQPDAMSHIGVDPWTVAISAWPLVLALSPHVLVRPLSRPQFTTIGARPTIAVVALCALLFGADKLAYGAFYFKGAPFVFELKSAAPVYPTLHEYHVRQIYGTLLGQESKVGFMQPLGQRLDREDAAPGSRFAYPSAPLPDSKLARPLNIVFIVAESLRAGDVDGKSAPRLTSLAGESVSAARHFSASNCTHLAVFSLLYGLNPYYFHDARMAKTRPVGMQVLEQSNYGLYATLARTMKWYDLDRFAFGGLTSYEPEGESNVARDRAVTDRAVAIAREHAASGKPYFNFVYYYSTHADYQHPEDAAPFQPALTGPLNLSAPGMRDKRVELVNRYRNAISFVDSEVGRLVDSLKREGVWENTLLVFTGDHGEEFYEEGRLGHNSGFNLEQTQVPMVMHIPGEAPRRLDKLTSHMDVFQTLLGALGAPEPVMSNFQGRNMLGSDGGPVYIGMAHFQRPQKFAIVDRDTRVVVDLAGGSPVIEGVSDLAGKGVSSPPRVDVQVLGLLQQMQRLRAKGAGGSLPPE